MVGYNFFRLNTHYAGRLPNLTFESILTVEYSMTSYPRGTPFYT